jgi:Family of unknown function (DUF6516)
LAKQSDPHAPILFRNYRTIHETVMERFKVSRFVGEETLEFTNQLPGVIELRGEIACLGNLLITVEKYLRILSGEGDNALVQTSYYIYNVSLRGYGNVLRYDNSHDRPGHPDRHHKHQFNLTDEPSEPEESGDVVWVGRQSWPTLGRVIQEVQEWYWLNREALDKPDSYPQLGLRTVGQNPSIEKILDSGE